MTESIDEITELDDDEPEDPQTAFFFEYANQIVRSSTSRKQDRVIRQAFLADPRAADMPDAAAKFDIHTELAQNGRDSRMIYRQLFGRLGAAAFVEYQRALMFAQLVHADSEDPASRPVPADERMIEFGALVLRMFARCKSLPEHVRVRKQLLRDPPNVGEVPDNWRALIDAM